ncbi:YdcF family protein [Aquihabitans daechungensis]|uniref:YdcF family protein n=1 Tax=Aquihabitans daechungensis TaxID=1052257 RepID=UPI003B9DFE83
MGGAVSAGARMGLRGDDEAVASAFAAAWDHLVVEDPLRPTDAIFCFGSRHWRVPERAATLFAAGVAPFVVVTGGPSVLGERSEAERFAADLVAAGVPPDRLILEHAARHTGENVVFGLDHLRRHLDPRRLTLVSWPLAARRCRATFAHLAPEVAVGSAPALRHAGHRWRPTPRRIRFALGELDRLRRYSADGLIAAHERPAAVDDAVAVLQAALARADAGPWPARSAHDPALRPVEPARPLVEAEARPLVV